MNQKTKNNLKTTAALLAYCIGIPLLIMAYPTLYRFGLLLERGMIEIFAPDLLPVTASQVQDANPNPVPTAVPQKASAPR